MAQAWPGSGLLCHPQPSLGCFSGCSPRAVQLNIGFGCPNPSGDKARPSLGHAAQAQQGQGPPGPPTARSSQGPWLTPATRGLALNAAILTKFSAVCCYSLFCGGVSQGLCFSQGTFLQAALCPAQKLLTQRAEETKTIKTWLSHGEQVHLLANQQHGQAQAPTKTLQQGGAELPHPYSLWPNICHDPKKQCPHQAEGPFLRALRARGWSGCSRYPLPTKPSVTKPPTLFHQTWLPSGRETVSAHVLARC